MSVWVRGLAILMAVLMCVVALSQRSGVSSNKRPITRAEVEAIFDRAPRDRTGGIMLSAVPHAPRDVAIVVWPASDAELLKLLPKYPQWVVKEALLRSTPGVVPTLEAAINQQVQGGASRVRVIGPYAGQPGAIVEALQKIKGLESAKVLHRLATKKDPRVRIASLHALSVGKRALPDQKAAVKVAIQKEIKFNFRAASALGPGMLMLSSPSEAIPILKRVRESAIHEEAHGKPPSGPLARMSKNDLRQLRIDCSIWLASIGDQASLPAVRSVLKNDLEGFMAVEAIQMLAERIGASERTTLEAALTAPSSRTREMATLYLGKIGDMRSVKALRAASKVKAPDEANGWRDSIRRRMIEVADAIESGQRYQPKFRTGTPVPWWRL